MDRQSERNKQRSGQQRLLTADLDKVLAGGALAETPPSVEEIMTPAMPEIEADDLIEESGNLQVSLTNREVAEIKAGNKVVIADVARRNQEAANAKMGEPLEPAVDDSPMVAAQARRKGRARANV